MWQIVVITLLVAVVHGEKLDQVFQPPTGAATAGGFPGDIAAPPTYIPIISYDNVPNAGDGSYSYSYETANGIKASEEGAVKNLEPEGQAQVVQGVFSYTGPDGKIYTLAYTADENGFQPRGDHLPTPPPIPAEIQAALEQNAAEEAAAAGGSTEAPPQVGYFKSYPSVFQNRNYNRNYNQQQQQYSRNYNYNQHPYNRYYNYNQQYNKYYRNY